MLMTTCMWTRLLKFGQCQLRFPACLFMIIIDEWLILFWACFLNASFMFIDNVDEFSIPIINWIFWKCLMFAILILACRASTTFSVNVFKRSRCPFSTWERLLEQVLIFTVIYSFEYSQGHAFEGPVFWAGLPTPGDKLLFRDCWIVEKRLPLLRNHFANFINLTPLFHFRSLLNPP